MKMRVGKKNGMKNKIGVEKRKKKVQQKEILYKKK
jgi:hypothetical protein